MTAQTVSRVWTRDSVIDLLNKSEVAVARAIKQLFARQTSTEQSSKQTRERNGRGFNANDAPFLSDIARKLPYYNDHMTPRQLAKSRRMLRKYTRQLLEIIEENGGQVDFGKPRNRETAVSQPTAAPPVAQLGPEFADPEFGSI